jgi:hypothetical protein
VLLSRAQRPLAAASLVVRDQARRPTEDANLAPSPLASSLSRNDEWRSCARSPWLVEPVGVAPAAAIGEAFLAKVIWAEVRPGSGIWVLALTAQDGLEHRDRDDLLAVYPWIAPMIARDVSAHQSGNH